MRTHLENWSRDYVLAPGVEVNTHHDDKAIMDETLYAKLVEVLGEPIIGFVGGIHYEFLPSTNVLAERAAIPTANHRADKDRYALLLAK